MISRLLSRCQRIRQKVDTRHQKPEKAHSAGYVIRLVVDYFALGEIGKAKGVGERYGSAGRPSVHAKFDTHRPPHSTQRPANEKELAEATMRLAAGGGIRDVVSLERAVEVGFMLAFDGTHRWIRECLG